MKTMQKGFTLIELMIVVAIIAILAAIALPAYQDYTIRTQVSEGVTLASGAKTAVTEYFSNYGVYPITNAAAGLAKATSIRGNYVTQVAVGNNGVITATYGNKANTAIATKKVALAPSAAATDGSVVWKNDSSTDVAPKYLPSSLR